jgi:CRISPR-associated protein Cmr2
MADLAKFLGDRRDKALLSFFLGPVQPFIAGARTVRDLWAGSYLLSWLVGSALRPVLGAGDDAVLITPDVQQDNPLVRAVREGQTGDPRATTPCLPNKFFAAVRAGRASELAAACVAACRDEWGRVEGAVRAELDRLFAALPHGAGWDQLWAQQVSTFFEVRTACLPLAGCGEEECRSLLARQPSDLFAARVDVLSGLLDARRSVRHVPAYPPGTDEFARSPAKCSLMGTLEQMGPAGLAEAGELWRAAQSCGGLRGSRVGPRERLCAVSLVKRFAWPAYFARSGGRPGRLGVPLHELRFSDTATVAAALWLRSGEPLSPERVRREHGDWSGQWLHWSRPDQDRDDPCRPEVWAAVEPVLRRKRRSQGPAPAYFAVLMLDGDRMGELLRGTDPDPARPFPRGPERSAEVSRRLTRYALHRVEEIVEARHHGELIYAGGDDVLALLPTRSVLPCAADLRRAYGDELLGARASAGVAVVHHKEDLHFALAEARRAERAAKDFGRDALALRVCRRSGEHSGAALGWDQVAALDQLTRRYADTDVSDRWAYRLRAELPALVEMPRDARPRLALEWRAVEKEARRLLGRLEGREDELALFRTAVERFLAGYRDELRQRQSRRGETERPTAAETDAAALEGFVTLCQAASFLARGRDDR